MGWFSSMFSGRKQRLAMTAQAEQYRAQLAAQEEAANRQIEAQREMASQVTASIRAANAQPVQEAAATTAESPEDMTSGNTAVNAKRRVVTPSALTARSVLWVVALASTSRTDRNERHRNGRGTLLPA